MIQCKNISKSYNSGFLGLQEKKALENITLSIEPNQVFGIVGPNGAGKSTILKILMGFVRPTLGQAHICGYEVGNHFCHSQIGYLPEHPSLYQHLSPYEHLHFACRVSEPAPNNIETRIFEALKLVDLTDVTHVAIKKFSKGMTQRAALAYAIISNPKLLILDEPMSGLDPIGRQLVIDIILKYKDNGCTILFCSHILTDVERICDRIGIMHQGRLIATTTPQDLSGFPTINRVDIRTPLEYLFNKLILENS